MALSDADWAAVRLEWAAGQLAIREIARQYNVSDASIRKRAKKENWPERPAAGEVVREGARGSHTRELSANQALQAFDRVLELLHRHRSFISRLNVEWAILLEDLAEVRTRKTANKKAFTLKEIALMADILAKASSAMTRLIPLERQAFGFTDSDGPSEFDRLSPEEVEEIMETVRSALGR